MKTKQIKRGMAALLTFCMVLFAVPFTAHAASDPLPDAFAQLAGAADYNAETGTITLTADVVLESYISIPSETNVIIDLAGHTISSPAGCFGIYSKNVKVTFRDSSPEGTGVVSSGAQAIYVQSGSGNHLTIESGTYVSTSEKAQSAVGFSFAFDDNQLKISGGNFIANYTALSISGFSDSNIQLTGGYFQTSGSVDGASSISSGGSGYSKRTIASMIPSSCYVSLNGGDAVATAEAADLNAQKYAGTIRIFSSAPPQPTPDSQQSATVKAVAIDNPAPPVNVPTYTTTIPAELNLGTLRKSSDSNIKQMGFEVKVADVQNLDGKQVHIAISVSEDGFNLKNGSNALPYQVFNTAEGGTALKNNDTFVDFTADATQAGRIEVDQANITAVGNYSGTLTFTIALAEPSN